MSPHADEHWMRLALDEARAGLGEEEVPVGAVVVVGDDVIARAHNRVIGLGDPTAHGEILALREAARRLGNYRVTGARLYVTLEPCLMCAAALVQARVERLVYGTPSPKFGFSALVPDFFALEGLNHRVEVTGGVCGTECGEILRGFFEGLRGE